MSNTPNFATPPIVVPANGSIVVNITGNYLINLTSSMVAGTLQIKIGDGRFSRFDAQDTYILPQGENFNSVTIFNTTGAQVTFQLGVATGEIKAAGAVTVAGTVAVSANLGSTLHTYPDVVIAAGATTQILAQNLNRKEAIFTNNLVNNHVVRWGDNAAGAAQGPELGIGAEKTLSNTAAIYVYNPTAGNITISVLENNA